MRQNDVGILSKLLDDLPGTYRSFLCNPMIIPKNTILKKRIMLFDSIHDLLMIFFHTTRMITSIVLSNLIE